MRILFLILLIVGISSACIDKSGSDHKDNGEPNKIVRKRDSVVEDTNIYKSYIEEYQNETNDTAAVDEYYTDPLVVSYSQHSDTMVINENCAIFIWPDSLEIVEIQNKYPIKYLEILDDMISYASDVAIELDAAGIKNFYCDKLVIKFINTSENTIMHRKKVEGDMILFKHGKKPCVLKVIEFDIEYAKAFFTDDEEDV